MLPLDIFDLAPLELRSEAERKSVRQHPLRVALHAESSKLSHSPKLSDMQFHDCFDGFPMSPEISNPPLQVNVNVEPVHVNVTKRSFACQVKPLPQKRNTIALAEAEALAEQLQIVEASFERLKGELQAKRALAENHRVTVLKTKSIVQKLLDSLPSELCATNQSVKDLQKLLDIQQESKAIFTTMRVAPVVTLD